MTKQRLTLISLIGLLMFGLLLGGQILYEKKWVDMPLLEQSQRIPGITSAKVIEVNGVKEFRVITDHVTNLQAVSHKLSELAGKRPIRFEDQRNEELERLFQNMQFALQEGIATGNFTKMENNVKAQAAQAGVDLELTMDSGYIYVTLNQGQNQLVEVLERHQQGVFLPSEKNNS